MERRFNGDKITSLRKDLRIRYSDIERKTGITASSFQNKERYQNVRMHEFLSLCNGFKIPVCYFISDNATTDGMFTGEWRDVSFDYARFKEDVIRSRKDIKTVCVSLGITYAAYRKRFDDDGSNILISDVCSICQDLNLELSNYLLDPNIPLTPLTPGAAEPTRPTNTKTGYNMISGDNVVAFPRPSREEELQRYVVFIESEISHLQTLVKGLKAIINMRPSKGVYSPQDEDCMMAAEDENDTYNK